MSQKLKFSNIVMMTLASVVSTMSISASYSFASAVFFYDIFICLLFFLPASLIVGKFSSENSTENGIFYWVSRGLGWRTGVLAILLQWLANVFFYPITLLFILSSIAKVFSCTLTPCVLFLGTNLVFWTLTYVNLKGIGHTTRWIGLTTILGLFLPLFILTVATALSSSLSHAYVRNILIHVPPLNIESMRDPLLITFAAFLGVEINAVHTSSVKNPLRTIPRAIVISACTIVLCIVGGTALMLAWLPPTGVNVGNAFADSLLAAMQSMGLESFSFIIIVLMLLGPLGGIIACIISPIQALHQCMQSTFPSKSSAVSTFSLLIFQAILVTFISLLNFIFDINIIFSLMIDAMVALYLIMYILMFISALLVIDNREIFISNFNTRLCCTLGLISCVSCHILCFWKPGADALHYVVWFALLFFTCVVPYVWLTTTHKEAI